jgi:hypothetical protein
VVAGGVAEMVPDSTREEVPDAFVAVANALNIFTGETASVGVIV